MGFIWVEQKIYTSEDQNIILKPTPFGPGFTLEFEESDGSRNSGTLYITKETYPAFIKMLEWGKENYLK